MAFTISGEALQDSGQAISDINFYQQGSGQAISDINFISRAAARLYQTSIFISRGGKQIEMEGSDLSFLKPDPDLGLWPDLRSFGIGADGRGKVLYPDSNAFGHGFPV